MSVIPMDQHAAIEADKRAQAEAERSRKYELKQRLAAKKLDLKRYQQKHREITKCNATMLSANGDLLLRQEIYRLQSEVEELQKDLEAVGAKKD